MASRLQGRGGLPRQLGVSAVMATLVLLGAALPPPVGAARSGPKNPEDLLIVDCLLPGQVRKLGASATFMSARRPIRTTQADCEIRGGEYVSYDRANYQTALQVWMTQALSGSAEAQNYVGEIYLKGLGTPPDYGMAAQWFQKAADQGFKRAKTNLAYLYEEGLGVQKDALKALNLYREASGASSDELLFASAVKVQLEAKDTQIASLQQTVDEQRKQADALRAQVRDLQAQLDSRKQAMQSAQAELGSLRQQLAQARQATGANFAELDQKKAELAREAEALVALQTQLEAEKAAAQRREQQLAQQQAALQQKQGELGAGAASDPGVATLQEQAARLSTALAEAQRRSEEMQARLVASQSRLDQQRKDYEARIAALESQAAGRNQDDWELMKLLESQLAQRETALREQQVQIAQLEQQVAANGGALLAAAPTLEIIDPPLTLTRGRSAAMLRGAPGRHSLVGKVSVPQAVQQITVNGTPVIIGDNGLFRASVEVPAGGSTVQVAAVSRTGDAATLEFTMLPQAGAGPAQGSGAGNPARAVPAGVKLGSYHALVIGNNSYQSGSFGVLQSAVNDATAVSQMLKDRYGYKTTLLLNATRFDMLSALNELRETLKPEDNLLVYYAGHGELSADGKMGYWIPVDGQPGMHNTWISNTAISDILSTMEARHVLVVADSCYSGALAGSAMPLFAAGEGGKPWGDWVKTMADGRSRIALTSGGVQPVPDTGTGKHSFFARAFLNALEDNNRLLEGQALYREVTSALALASLDAPLSQVPVYAPIQFAGHETGEFFFLPKGAGAAP